MCNRERAKSIQRSGQRSDDRTHLFTASPSQQSNPCAGFDVLLSLRNNNKRRSAMFKFKHSKVRQAGWILFTTTLLLIVPNLNRLFG
ncbi:hypothetical protein ALQ36_100767 [Pseudomonas syringae pv. primulae]|uniref:Uncharacterized protein n=3 Tax=Pseudomonas syringae group TaxID=136849 RepID=A0A3M3XKJ9_9PSED|nr:hypothetical protein ALQ94_100423 [Pseudomonas amygdali pv. morsprunorum]RMO70570.1 hypothetical protein ALQ36_100767 [Pseudomonas syringae pv. primulae]RMR09846.1 hypothetical protein ALP92_100798 [Pseudomonas syringae pv. primulae]RMU34869.1 hypothetical protein ALP30_100845 [Pseudomonas syringae pv. primulae]